MAPWEDIFSSDSSSAAFAHAVARSCSLGCHVEVASMCLCCLLLVGLYYTLNKKLVVVVGGMHHNQYTAALYCVRVLDVSHCYELFSKPKELSERNLKFGEMAQSFVIYLF